jgi:hypothetical protein
MHSVSGALRESRKEMKRQRLIRRHLPPILVPSRGRCFSQFVRFGDRRDDFNSNEL